MTVFQIDREFKVILNPLAIKLVPELSSLTEEEVLYVILVMDYIDSPYRKKPYEERQLMARKKVFGDSKHNPETKRVLKGMEGYKGLVFDIRRETIDIYKTKILKLHKESLLENTSFVRMKEIDATMSFMQKKIDEYEHDIDIDEKDSIELKGKKQLSQIEVWQRKQKAFNEYQKNL
jgi:hypothetical protein